ncbi:MAG: Hsp70 family protein, partial [Myxococcota bacterium]
MSGKVVGIDLGTSNSVVSVVVNGQPMVIPDEDGYRLQPSVVSFLPDGNVLVGHKARDRKVLDPANTIYSVKRLIGRPFSSEEVNIAQTHYPYKVVKGYDNNPKVEVYGKQYSPEGVSSMLLRHMKQIAENFLGMRVEKAVITVPANFSESQRTATKMAGEMADMEVLRILNEPTAAALAYGYGQSKREKVAIYDFGGGTFDITILDLRGNVFEVMSTAGNTYLGGDDFDNRLVDYMVAAFRNRFNYDLSGEVVALQRLKNIAEKVKVDLSVKDRVAVKIQEIIPGSSDPVTLSFSITRQGFSERCSDIVKQTFLVCDEALRLANLSSSEIDHVVLVGGTTRIPVVQELVKDYFFREPVGSVNPDEVVSVGAAVYADSISGGSTATGADVGGGEGGALLIDVTPRGLGIATVGGYFDPIINRNENIPTERSRVFTTSRDNQESVRLEILEGESKQAEDNQKLGELQLGRFRVVVQLGVFVGVVTQRQLVV